MANSRTGRDWIKGKVTNQGGTDHIKARDRLIQIFIDDGFTCTTKQKFWAATLRGELPYEPDILVERGLVQAVVEVDGKSHGSHRQSMKDIHRDDWFENDENGPHIKTVRYPVKWVIGKGKLTNREIMEKFWDEVNN